MLKRTIFMTLMLAVLVPTVAFASVITPDNYDSLTGVNVLFGGGDAAIKTVDGYQSLGVSGGVSGEISIGQSITFDFAAPQIVDSINLVAFFADGNKGDIGNEMAQITAISGTTSWTYTLTSGINSAIWTGEGTASPLVENAGLAGNGGVWTITNPFGDTGIDSIVLTALDNGIASDFGHTNSDFGVGGVTTTAATPIPAAAWLLGSGLLGLAGLRRKRN